MLHVLVTSRSPVAGDAPLGLHDGDAKGECRLIWLSSSILLSSQLGVWLRPNLSMLFTSHLPAASRLVICMKSFVFVCHAGKVFGLHSGDGHLLWSLSFPADRRPSRLALWRTSHDAASAPEVLLLGNLPSGDAFYTTLNAHSGAVTSSGDLPFRMDQVRLPAEEPLSHISLFTTLAHVLVISFWT